MPWFFMICLRLDLKCMPLPVAHREAFKIWAIKWSVYGGLVLVKGEGHSKNPLLFVNANKNLALSLATCQSFSPLSEGFPYETHL